MAVLSFLFGCTIGALCAVIGLVAYGMPLLSAFGLYLSVSTLVGVALTVKGSFERARETYEIGA